MPVFLVPEQEEEVEEESRILGVGLGTVRKNPECPGDLIDTCAMQTKSSLGQLLGNVCSQSIQVTRRATN